MHQWQWRTRNGTQFLTCDLLDRWPHGFFTRQAWPQTPHELVEKVHPTAEVLRVKQVHGNTVLSASQVKAQRVPEDFSYPDADGVYSDAQHQSLWVCSADCTPVLIADARTGRVAAVHAGWRGTAARIVPEAIARLLDQGSQLEHLLVAMGPAIEGRVYQVTQEVAETVARSIQDWVAGPAASRTASLTAALLAMENSPLGVDDQPGRVKLDVRRVNALQLELLGLDAGQISIAPHCTYQAPHQFFSYRRDGLKKVQWSGIVSQE
ncbi:peptidoglycan editing factor PgeF [Lyngbya confervoides]|uniref:Purine nucleoside phosphorylase n=1 Tax=Lyngbya confervoides BDU141951 TaxID=1574623 RepID=A0ABD4T3F0_9CYAN|nr:peptidoglycan editing factor PgeF [Lyngbya confervoides]MCM1983208.1 peptidoglycan editing factor PgeF [Lyngbya confervoides BDU141951]